MKVGTNRRLLALLVIVLFLAILSSGLVNVSKLVDSTRPPTLYVKDFNVEYVMARAALNGESPYKPLPELARFADGYTAQFLQHPSPHPPPVIFIGIPFTFFDLSRAVLIWLLIELACIAVSAAIILKAVTTRVSVIGVVALFVVCIGWYPFAQEMFWGQLNIITLALTASAWVALRSGRDMTSGLFLGTALAIKLFGWPIILFLVITQKWRAVFGAALAFTFLNFAAALVIGFGEVVNYYVAVGPAVSKLYRAIAGNFSLWSIGPRVFDAGADNWYKPLIDIPPLAMVVSVVIVGGVAVLALIGALHTRSFDSAFCSLVCVSIVANPIAWAHYLVLTAPALCLVASRIRGGRATRKSMVIAGVVLVMAVLLEYALTAVIALAPRVSGAQLVPFAVGAITYLPLAFVLLLAYLTLISDVRPRDDGAQ